jgi:hypothetical protein
MKSFLGSLEHRTTFCGTKGKYYWPDYSSSADNKRDNNSLSSSSKTGFLNEEASSSSKTFTTTQLIDFNNVPSWINNKLTQHFESTRDRTIEIGRLKDIFCHEFIDSGKR